MYGLARSLQDVSVYIRSAVKGGGTRSKADVDCILVSNSIVTRMMEVGGADGHHNHCTHCVCDECRLLWMLFYQSEGNTNSLGLYEGAYTFQSYLAYLVLHCYCQALMCILRLHCHNSSSSELAKASDIRDPLRPLWRGRDPYGFQQT